MHYVTRRVVNIAGATQLSYRWHCNTLQHTATHCNTLQHSGLRMLPRMQVNHHVDDNATHCNILQHTATRCNTLSHTAIHRFANVTSATQLSRRRHWGQLRTANTLQHTATHCNTVLVHLNCHFDDTGDSCVLQHTATHCNTLQHTANVASATQLSRRWH